jgi:FkbM family methyltransferase
MSYPDLFEQFNRREFTSDGRSVYDFLGGRIDASFKHTWERNILEIGTKATPGYPALSEWTVDWIASLVAAKIADQNFTVIELGAGYGQWMVSSILAYRSVNSTGRATGLAVEADPTHFGWLQTNVIDNLGDDPLVDAILIHGAAGLDGSVTFPVLVDPSKDYGASYSLTESYTDTVEVECYSLARLVEKLPEQNMDMLHIDIQGAEEDLIQHPKFVELLGKTSVVLFGTHRTDKLHDEVKDKLLSAGFDVKVNWPRNGLVHTAFGDVKTNDGALLAVNPKCSEQAASLFDFSLLNLGGAG